MRVQKTLIWHLFIISW